MFIGMEIWCVLHGLYLESARGKNAHGGIEKIFTHCTFCTHTLWKKSWSIDAIFCFEEFSIPVDSCLYWPQCRKCNGCVKSLLINKSLLTVEKIQLNYLYLLFNFLTFFRILCSFCISLGNLLWWMKSWWKKIEIFQFLKSSMCSHKIELHTIC